MLTKERVLGTRWRYSCARRRADDDYPYDHEADFEVLKVEESEVLRIFISYKSTNRPDGKPDLIDLADGDLTLETLDGLVQEGLVRELTKTTQQSSDGINYSFEVYFGALVLFSAFGVTTFFAGIIGPNQKPWEVAIGAAFMIAALLALAIVEAFRRN